MCFSLWQAETPLSATGPAEGAVDVRHPCEELPDLSMDERSERPLVPLVGTKARASSGLFTRSGAESAADVKRCKTPRAAMAFANPAELGWVETEAVWNPRACELVCGGYSDDGRNCGFLAGPVRRGRTPNLFIEEADEGTILGVSLV